MRADAGVHVTMRSNCAGILYCRSFRESGNGILSGSDRGAKNFFEFGPMFVPNYRFANMSGVDSDEDK